VFKGIMAGCASLVCLTFQVCRVGVALGASHNSCGKMSIPLLPGHVYKICHVCTCVLGNRHKMLTCRLVPCRSRWFIPSTIVGATSVDMLRDNLKAFALELSEDVLKEIDEVHAWMRNPAMNP
jgi:hypothetical protein